jgi:hypothetical protein
MTFDDPRHDQWREALRMHEREIERLRVEIALLERERAGTGVVRDCVRLQIEFATAHLMRHQIGAALMATRLRLPPPG